MVQMLALLLGSIFIVHVVFPWFKLRDANLDFWFGGYYHLHRGGVEVRGSF